MSLIVQSFLLYKKPFNMKFLKGQQILLLITISLKLLFLLTYVGENSFKS
ncbi:hypothetical protein IE9_05492 [Bacillus cereus BAG4X12-1]|nr:hypothetical protein IE9_05492 [Bacillus cereus BAG4X12-1]EOP77746.1 hypothetical protein IEG_05534 [Bacillus cereus BAG5X12-1]